MRVFNVTRSLKITVLIDHYTYYIVHRKTQLPKITRQSKDVVCMAKD